MTFFDKTKQVEFEPQGVLRLVQKADKFPSIAWPFCDVKGCWNRSKRMYTDDAKKAFCICEGHNAEVLSKHGVFCDFVG